MGWQLVFFSRCLLICHFDAFIIGRLIQDHIAAESNVAIRVRGSDCAEHCNKRLRCRWLRDVKDSVRTGVVQSAEVAEIYPQVWLF